MKTLNQKLQEIEQGKTWEIGKRFIPLNQEILDVIRDTVRDTRKRIQEHLCDECKKKLDLEVWRPFE